MSAQHRRHRPEAAIQRAVFQHLRARSAPGVFAFHPANGGYRKPIEAAILKGLGVVPGVPDVFIVQNGHCFAMELKAEGGRATDKQLACIAALREAGAYCCIAEGLESRACRAGSLGTAQAGAAMSNIIDFLSILRAANEAERELHTEWEEEDRLEKEINHAHYEFEKRMKAHRRQQEKYKQAMAEQRIKQVRP
jgi:hypothetical protein